MWAPWVHVQEENTLLHFRWYERQGDVAIADAEVDIVVLPGEARLQKVAVCSPWNHVLPAEPGV